MRKILFGLIFSLLFGCSTLPNFKNEPGIYIAASLLLPDNYEDEEADRIKINDKIIIELNNIIPSGEIFVYNNDIYFIDSEMRWVKTGVGSIYVGKAVYYKNNQKYYLETERDYSTVRHIFIDKGDVYAIGEEYNLGTRMEFISRAVYWKNGKKYNIATNYTDSNENYIVAYDIYVENGNIYILGKENEIPKYWINGESFQISGNPDIMILHSIFAYNGDVYVIGCEKSGEKYIGRNGNERQKKIAKYWKNGIGINLSDGKNEADTTDIFVNNTGIYITGIEETGKAYILSEYPEYYDDFYFDYNYQNEPTIKLWINDREYKFEEGVSTSNRIFLDNNNIYIFGYKDDVPVIWKNFIPQNISNITKSDYSPYSRITGLYPIRITQLSDFS